MRLLSIWPCTNTKTHRMFRCRTFVHAHSANAVADAEDAAARLALVCSCSRRSFKVRDIRTCLASRVATEWLKVPLCLPGDEWSLHSAFATRRLVYLSCPQESPSVLAAATNRTCRAFKK